MTIPSAPRQLRRLLERDTPLVAPLALDPISAKWAEAAGFEALYLGAGTMGYATTATEGHVSVDKIVHAGLDIRAASALPIILDGICGWGDPMHLHHTVALVEAAGFAAIEIEDQLLPKRAHHHIGTEHLIPVELMVHKIEEAVNARRDPDFMVIARTNALRSDSVDEAVRRAEAYRSAGADMLFVLHKTPEQAKSIGERVNGPLMFSWLEGPRKAGLSSSELHELGYKLIIDGITPFLAAQRALRLTYESLAQGSSNPILGDDYRGETEMMHAAVGLDKLLEIEKRTVEF